MERLDNIMSIDTKAYPYYEQFPKDIQERIWELTLDCFRVEHKSKFAKIMKDLPWESVRNRLVRFMDNYFYNEPVDYIQYRNIRDFLQNLADLRQLIICFDEYCHEVCVSVGSNFDTNSQELDWEDRPHIKISRVYGQEINAPLYGSDELYIPRDEIPPTLDNKELVSVWFMIDDDHILKFPVNIDIDLVFNY